MSLTNPAFSGVATTEHAKSGVLKKKMRKRSQGLFCSVLHSDIFGTKDKQRSNFWGLNDKDKGRGKWKYTYKNVTRGYFHKNGYMRKCYYRY